MNKLKSLKGNDYVLLLSAGASLGTLFLWVASYIFPVRTGDFLIFPSGLLHYTETNTKDDARISISGDILLTMKEGIKTEHCIPHPKGWKTI